MLFVYKFLGVVRAQLYKDNFSRASTARNPRKSPEIIATIILPPTRASTTAACQHFPAQTTLEEEMI